MINTSRNIPTIALLLLAACGDTSAVDLTGDGDAAVPNEPGMDAGVDPGNESMGGEPSDGEAIRLDGVYTVPVTEPSLEPFASQPVVLDWREANEEFRMDYDFPTDLTGVSQRVSLEGGLTREGTIELAGDLGSATCTPDASRTTFVCTERLPQMAFDLQRLQRDFERRGLPSSEIARRLEVARVFQSDPIGILEFAVE